jgi:hypothetical protein
MSKRTSLQEFENATITVVRDPISIYLDQALGVLCKNIPFETKITYLYFLEADRVNEKTTAPALAEKRGKPLNVIVEHLVALEALGYITH